MGQIWIATIPVNNEEELKTSTVDFTGSWKLPLREIRKWFNEHDVHKWQIGKETSKCGYDHYQIRFRYGCKDDFAEITKSAAFQKAHLQWADKWSNYETKDGRYIVSDDNLEKLKIRFGKPKKNQLRVLKATMNQNDREITVWYDPDGNCGKSWLAHYLWQTRQAFYMSPTLNAKTMVQDVADGYDGEKIIVIDIPRTTKWSNELYIAIEQIKDGLVKETRYHSQTRSIRGVKVLVMTNSKPKLDKWSNDRWLIINEQWERKPYVTT